MSIHTLRGQIVEGTIKRLVVDDGRLNNGFIVSKFVICGNAQNSGGNDAMAVLGYQGIFPELWNFADNNQFAWASTDVPTLGSASSPFSLIDQGHTVLRDMFITGQVAGAGGNGVINYYIELVPVELSDDESILALIKERNQGVLRA